MENYGRIIKEKGKNIMTNANIILNESVKLMEAGQLKGTGEFITIETDAGKKQIEIPEEIHTFNGWKERGYQVKKGEKSTIKIPIWKHTTKDKPEEEKTGNPLEDAPVTNMFMKVSAFFKFSQVEPMKAKS